MLAVTNAKENVGQPVELQPASTDKNEDWAVVNDGTVSNYYAAGLVSAAIDQQYGSNNAYELEYQPAGVDSGLCLGVSGTAQNGTAATLQICGTSAATVWVSDTADQDGQQVPLINATTANVTQPLVLTVDGTGVDATTSSLTEASGQYWSTENWG